MGEFELIRNFFAAAPCAQGGEGAQPVVDTVLGAHHAEVGALDFGAGKKLVGRALGDDASPVHHHDAVGLEHGGEAMRDHQRRASVHELIERGLVAGALMLLAGFVIAGWVA